MTPMDAHGHHYDAVGNHGRLRTNLWCQSSAEDGTTWTDAVRIPGQPTRPAPTPRDIARNLVGWRAMIEVVEPRSVQDELARIGAELTARYPTEADPGAAHGPATTQPPPAAPGRRLPRQGLVATPPPGHTVWPGIGRKNLLPAGQRLPFLAGGVTAVLPGAVWRDTRRQNRPLRKRRRGAAPANQGGNHETTGSRDAAGHRDRGWHRARPCPWYWSPLVVGRPGRFGHHGEAGVPALAHRVLRGSSASRSPSPNKLKAITVRKIARPGMTMNIGSMA
jgi:hypothetical protein